MSFVACWQPFLMYSIVAFESSFYLTVVTVKCIVFSARCVRQNVPSCLSVTGVHCDHNHTVQFSVDLSLCLDSLTPKHVHLFSAVFFQFHLEERWGVDKCKLDVISQERSKIEAKLLLSANRKSYVPRRLAQQRMTLSDLEWPFPHCALSLR